MVSDADVAQQSPWPAWLLPVIDGWGGREFWYAFLWFWLGLGCVGLDGFPWLVWADRGFTAGALLLMFLGGVMRRRRLA